MKILFCTVKHIRTNTNEIQSVDSFATLFSKYRKSTDCKYNKEIRILNDILNRFRELQESNQNSNKLFSFGPELYI